MINNYINKAKTYTFAGKIRLIINVLWTYFFYKKCRLVRLPIYIRGKNLIDFGKGLTTGVAARIEAFSEEKFNGYKIKFGNNVQINDYVHIAAVNSIEIGNNVLIASKVFISDHNHGSYSGDTQCSPEIPPQNRILFSSPVTIEDNVWIGEFVSILQGVTIGKGSIIGANSVVSKSIPPYSIAFGVPAKVFKKYNSDSKKWELI